MLTALTAGSFLSTTRRPLCRVLTDMGGYVSHRFKLWMAGVVVALLTVAGLGVGSAANVGAVKSVRGFDGTTITVATLGQKARFTNTPLGVQARIKEFNDKNEIKGVKIDWKEFADDKEDVSLALSEARRLVTQVGVFAIVGDVSTQNPSYLKQQKVPYFGWAFDDTYCSTGTSKPDTSVYGFGYNGCLVPSDPKVVANSGAGSYKYVSKETGKKHPTLLMFTTDSTSGKRAVKFQSVAMEGAGYDVIGTNSQLPSTPVGDYSPYVQAYMTSDNGKPPDAMACVASVECIALYSGVRAAGFTGSFISSLYSDLVVKPMDGSAADTPFVPFTANTPGQQKLKDSLDAFQPGASAKLDTAMMAGYLSTDMFIQALKTVAKKGKSNITPENVQKAAMNQTWEIKGVAGPTTYPKATVSSYPKCVGTVLSDGTILADRDGVRLLDEDVPGQVDAEPITPVSLRGAGARPPSHPRSAKFSSICARLHVSRSQCESCLSGSCSGVRSPYGPLTHRQVALEFTS